MAYYSSFSLRNQFSIRKMSSNSDSEHNKISADEQEEMNLESDAELLEDEGTVESTKKETKKPKKSFDPRYLVPTYEEKQLMRNADMEIEVSMLEIEVSILCMFRVGNCLTSYRHLNLSRVSRVLISVKRK